jgi:heat shock protein HslJ
MLRVNFFLWITVFSIAVIGCASSKTELTETDSRRTVVTRDSLPQIAGIEWHLVKMEKNRESIPLAQGSKVTFMIKEDGRVAGLATLNRYFGNMNLDEEGLITWKGPGLGMTKMAGPPDLMNQEDASVEALIQCQQVYREGSLLILEGQDQSVILEFQQAKE